MGYCQELFVKSTANSNGPLDKIGHLIQQARVNMDVFIHFQEFVADQVPSMVRISDDTEPNGPSIASITSNSEISVASRSNE